MSATKETRSIPQTWFCVMQTSDNSVNYNRVPLHLSPVTLDILPQRYQCNVHNTQTLSCIQWQGDFTFAHIAKRLLTWVSTVLFVNAVHYAVLSLCTNWRVNKDGYYVRRRPNPRVIVPLRLGNLDHFQLQILVLCVSV